MDLQVFLAAPLVIQVHALAALSALVIGVVQFVAILLLTLGLLLLGRRFVYYRGA